MSKIILLGTLLAASFGASAGWVKEDMCTSTLLLEDNKDGSFTFQTVEKDYFNFVLERTRYKNVPYTYDEVISVVVNGKRVDMNVNSEFKDSSKVSLTSYNKKMSNEKAWKQIYFIQNELKTKNELVINHPWGTSVITAKGFSKAWKEYLDCQL